MTGNIQNNKNEVLLTALSSDPENDSVTYEWIGLSPDNLYAEGTHTVQVRAVDQYGAASGWFTKTFDTKEPIKAMFEEWQNYIITGASGQWKYDEITKTIYSTQNVDWTGYWNPVDRALKDYKLTFKMGVTPANDDDVVGMGIRMQDTKNMYLVTVDKYYPTLTNGVGGYHSGLYKIVNGSPRLLVDFKPLSWQPNQFMNVEIRTQGNRITVLIDGVKWADYTDASSPYLSGAYGPMTISQANGVFKDLGISQIK
jgi:hypothetical protein